jgi:type IV secretory pathway VirJ component
MMILSRILAVGLVLAGAGFASAQQPASEQTGSQTDDYKTGMIVSPHITLPANKDLKAMVFLISKGAGWGAEEESQAKALVDQGAAVVGIDYPSYIASLSKDDGDCIYMVSDIEDLSQQVQRRIGNANYRHPIIAGIGDGGALALGMIAQSPFATISKATAVDPSAGIPLEKVLCTPATKDKAGDRTIYGFTDGKLPADVTIGLTDAADAAGKDHAASLKAGWPDVDLQTVSGPAPAALGDLLKTAIEGGGDSDQLDLPVTVLETKPTLDTMAVVYSGDGGWRDIDSELGGFLQAQGVPVVGVDSLRYFWAERTPQETADDLVKIIDTYRRQWNVKNVVLIGYSFGADILPATFNVLPAATKSRIKQMSLLALSREVDFEISVTGWLGVAGDGKNGDSLADIAKIDPHVVQCVYGTDEDDDPCPTLKAQGIETVGIEGGHHFDEDYEGLGKLILDSLHKRLGR